MRGPGGGGAEDELNDGHDNSNPAHGEQQQYRGCRSGWDVEQRNSVLGTLGDHVILWKRVKRLKVHQHLIRLVDAGRANIAFGYTTGHEKAAGREAAALLDLWSVFQKRLMTEVRYGLVMGFLWVQLMSCRMS